MKVKLTLLLFFFSVIPSSGLSKAQVKSLPNFKLKNLRGQVVTAKNFKGKVLLINFWATWCGPCKQEIPDLVKLKNRYRDNNFEIVSIAVNSGSPKDIAAFARKMNMNYPVLIGNAKVVKAFGNVSMLPTTFIVDRQGGIQKMFVGMKTYQIFEKSVKPLLEIGGQN